MNLLRPNEFRWSEAPLNKDYQPLCAVFVYLVLIHLLEWNAIARGVSSRFLRTIQKVQAVHNLALSLVSLIMVGGMMYSSWRVANGYYPNDPDAVSIVQFHRNSPMLGGVVERLASKYSFLICSRGDNHATGRIWYWVYVFYLTKYWELFDTILQMSKGRRPPSYHFHVWHHTCYLMICFYYLKNKASLSPLAVIINGGVHVIMYYYYHLNSLGIVPKWKRHITKVQIVQFVIGYLAFLYQLKVLYFNKLECHGQATLRVHAAFNLTMLLGFLQIFTRISNEQKKKR